MKKLEKVIFLHKSEWGEKNEIKGVARGFARYLLSQKYIILANKKNLFWLERQKLNQIKVDSISEENIQKKYNKINNLSLSFVLKKNKEGKPFSSVSFKNILQELKKDKIYLKKNQLLNFYSFNEVGEKNVKVKLASHLIANLKIIIK